MPAVKLGQDTCTVTLNLEKLCDLPLANIRKLYAMILSEPWRADNTDAAATVSAILDEAIETSKRAWAMASSEYQNGWRLVRSKKARDPETVEILSTNKALTRAVRRTKAAHEHWKKLKAIWVDAQTRYSY